ncbi:MAG: hypothetical protein NTW27_06720, partial [Deltaproteobacteria bacterium]|nr:hypothetical protein [Deltaproteobacteria bacterium]
GTTGKLTVTLSVSYGTLTVQVPATTPGSTPVTYTNSLITFTDTLANVNTALAGLSYTPTAKYDGDVTLSITAVDQSVPNPLFDTKTVTITVNNADPTITAPATFPVVTGSPTTITGISVADPDIGSTNMAVTLSVSHGVLNVATSTNVTGNGTSTLIINDTLANVNARLSGLQYTPTSTYSGSDTLKITANDQSTPTPGIGTGEVLITVNAIVNAPPVVTVPTATQSVSENSSIAITGISVSDADIGTTGKLTVTLSVSHGTVTVQVPGTTPTTYTNSIVTFTDTLSNVNTALAGLLYTPTAKYDNGDTLSVTAVDQSVPNPLFDTKTVAITVTNFAPSITAPATLPVVAGFPTTITGITVSDPDIGSTNMAVTLSVSYGALKEATSTVWSSTLTINDTLANVNTRLSGLQYVTYTGPDTLTITANDQSNPTAGTDSETVNITVTALPLSPPVITVPGTQTVNWNVPTPISDIYVEESGYTGQFTVTLSVLHGTVTVQVPATTPGTTPTVYTNANVTFTDTLTNINTALAGIKYTPTTGYAGAETLTITGVDQNSTPLSDSETVHITVINYAPAPVPLPPITITAPVVLSVNEDTAVTIRSAITVDYSDPGRELKVTLHVDHGSVTLGWKGWLDSYTGDVTPDAVFTGMVADVNNALYGLRYTPVHNYYGPDTLTVTVDDQSIPAVPVIKTVRLNVNSINDPPLITAPGTLDADQNVTKLISGVSVTDPELLDSPLLKMNMTLGVLHGTVAVTGAGPSPNIVFTDTLAQSNSRLGTLTYTPVPTYQGPDWLTISANDQGNSGSGGPMSDTKTVLIKVGKW